MLLLTSMTGGQIRRGEPSSRIQSGCFVGSPLPQVGTGEKRNTMRDVNSQRDQISQKRKETEGYIKKGVEKLKSESEGEMH